MAANIVLIHDDSDFLDRATKALQAVESAPLSAHDARSTLRTTRQIEILITRRLNNIDAAHSSRTHQKTLPCGDQLFPFTVVRVRSPAKCWSQHSLVGVGRINHIHRVRKPRSTRHEMQPAGLQVMVNGLQS